MTSFLRRSSQLYTIEQDDHKIDEELSTIILDVEKKLLHFCSHINENTLVMKEERLHELQQELIPCRKDLQQLYSDIQKIVQIKRSHQSQLVIKDSEFLLDKQQQIRKLQEEINCIFSILAERPSQEQLEHELIGRLKQQLHDSHDAIQRLLSDDEHLQLIYRALEDL